MTPAELPLRDIHLPPAPGWWPPAPGWWGLVPVAVALCLLAVWLRRRTRRRRSAFAEARRELQRLRGDWRSRAATQIAAELSALLRRVAISLFPRAQVAGLTGEAWLAFLDDVQGGDGFRRGPGCVLTRLPYRRGAAAADIEPLLDLCGAWIDAAQARMERGGR
jgi:hypothetical protein